MQTFTRRAFIKLASLSAAALATLSPLVARAKKVALKLTKLEALSKVGGAAVITIRERPVLLVRDTEESVRAFDATCTHKQCTVGWDAAQKRIQCPCHKSAFDLEGKVLGGPAPKPLTRYPSWLKEGRVIIDLGGE